MARYGRPVGHRPGRTAVILRELKSKTAISLTIGLFGMPFEMFTSTVLMRFPHGLFEQWNSQLSPLVTTHIRRIKTHRQTLTWSRDLPRTPKFKGCMRWDLVTKPPTPHRAITNHPVDADSSVLKPVVGPSNLAGVRLRLAF